MENSFVEETPGTPTELVDTLVEETPGTPNPLVDKTSAAVTAPTLAEHVSLHPPTAENPQGVSTLAGEHGGPTVPVLPEGKEYTTSLTLLGHTYELVYTLRIAREATQRWSAVAEKAQTLQLSSEDTLSAEAMNTTFDVIDEVAELVTLFANEAVALQQLTNPASMLPTLTVETVKTLLHVDQLSEVIGVLHATMERGGWRHIQSPKA